MNLASICNKSCCSSYIIDILHRITTIKKRNQWFWEKYRWFVKGGFMKKIYIILSQTGTLFSTALRFYTKDPYNHASISFDADLQEMYSFGRRHRYNFLNSGFVYENFNEGMYKFFPNAKCHVLEVSVTQEKYEAMKEAIHMFCMNKESYHYNIIGILAYATGVKLTRKNHFFCSQFVSYILSEADMWNRHPEFTKPMDFYSLPNVTLVYEGKIKDFSKSTQLPMIIT